MALFGVVQHYRKIMILLDGYILGFAHYVFYVFFLLDVKQVINFFVLECLVPYPVDLL